MFICLIYSINKCECSISYVDRGMWQINIVGNNICSSIRYKGMWIYRLYIHLLPWIMLHVHLISCIWVRAQWWNDYLLVVTMHYKYKYKCVLPFPSNKCRTYMHSPVKMHYNIIKQNYICPLYKISELIICEGWVVNDTCCQGFTNIPGIQQHFW